MGIKGLLVISLAAGNGGQGATSLLKEEHLADWGRTVTGGCALGRRSVIGDEEE